MTIVGGGLTAAQARRQRKQLLEEIEREHRRKDREKLAAIRQQIVETKQRRKQAMRDAVDRCRRDRKAARQRAKDLRRAASEHLAEAIRQDKVAAREACSARKAEVRQSGATDTQKARELLRAEKAYQREIRQVDRRTKERERLASARERRQESDDEVRAQISPDLLPAFERVKRQVRGSEHQSRTEAFLRWAEEHPADVVSAMEDLSEREIRKLIAEEKRLAKAKRSPRRYKPTADELAAIPF